MDQNEVYAQLIAAQKRYNEVRQHTHWDYLTTVDAADEMSAAFTDLNRWLARGGFAPDWKE
jgi:hypothetical protein